MCDEVLAENLWPKRKECESWCNFGHEQSPSLISNSTCTYSSFVDHSGIGNVSSSESFVLNQDGTRITLIATQSASNELGNRATHPSHGSSISDNTMVDTNQTRHGRSAAMMIVTVASVGLLCCYHEQNVRRLFSPSSNNANQKKVHLETERRNLMLAGIDLDVNELHDLVMVKRYKTDEPSMAPSIARTSRPPLSRKQRKRQRNRRKKRNNSSSSIVPTQSLGTQAPTWVYSYMRGPEPTAEIETVAPTLNATSEPSLTPSLILTTAPPTVTIGNENINDKRNRNQVIKDQEQSISFMTEAPTFQLATETPTIGIIGTHPPTLTPRNMQPSSAPSISTAAPSFLFDNMEGVPTTTPVKRRMRKTIAPTVRMRRRRSKTVAPTRRMRRRPPTIAPTRRKRRVTAAPTANALTLAPSSAAPSVVPVPTQEPTVHMFTDFWPTPSPLIATELPQSEVNGNRD
ncbi:hypothetical protein MPSEU_000069800 [Mayamaea pseudoterrestris]|nr:hypothetical protein MPSEU_000069800 [Mayamaea pseudoterrestris]